MFPSGDNTVLTGPSRHLASTRFRLGPQEGRHIEHATGPIYTLFAFYNYLKLIQQSFVPEETLLHTSPQASQHQQCQRQQSCSTHIAAVLLEPGHRSVLVDFRNCAVCLHLHSYSNSTGRRTQGTSERCYYRHDWPLSTKGRLCTFCRRLAVDTRRKCAVYKGPCLGSYSIFPVNPAVAQNRPPRFPC